MLPNPCVYIHALYLDHHFIDIIESPSLLAMVLHEYAHFRPCTQHPYTAAAASSIEHFSYSRLA